MLRKLANTCVKALERIAGYTDCIAEVRGKGLMLGVEIVKPNNQKNKFGEPEADPEMTANIQRAALERGLIIEKGGRQGAVLRFLPPLIISYEQIDFALDALSKAILATAGPATISEANAESDQEQWRSYFIHTGEGGADELETLR